MTRRSLIVTIVVAVVAFAAIMLGIFHKDVAIAYHDQAMIHAQSKIMDVGPGSSDQARWIESYDHHRDALVRLGYLEYREFPLSVKPPETNRFWKQLTAEFPDNFHAMMQSTEWGWPENKVLVWDRPENMSAWEAAIRKYDIPAATSAEGFTDSAE